jgi:glycosyltransferase involved in cell wall biosynthesis
LVQLPLAARKLKASLSHVQYSVSPLFGNRVISTIHDVSFLVQPSWFERKDQAVLANSTRLAAKQCPLLITVSQASQKDMERLVPASRSKVRVVHNAASPSVVQAPLFTSDEIRAKFGIRDPFLLTAGTGWPRKNHKLAVESFLQSDASGSHQLVVAGHPGGESIVHPAVVHTGYVTDAELRSLYENASLYLAPSFYEGFGITILEAMACGCPVVCSKGGAQPEVAGDAAIVMPTFEVHAWSRVLDQLLSDGSMLPTLRSKGLMRAGQFSWSRSAEQTAAVYREALNLIR